MDETEPPSTFPALFAKVVAERGDQDAVRTPSETISYAELDRRSARMARALLAIGAGKGTRVALMAPDGLLWLTAFLANLRIGTLVTTVSTFCTPPELAHILRNSDCQIFLGARGFLRHDYARTLAAAFPGLSEAKALRLSGAPYLRSIWLDDADGLGWARSIDDLLAHADGPDAPDAALLAAVEREVAPSDDAVVVYTSGSTAQPKAIVHRQWAVARHPPELAKFFILKPGDRMMCLMPAFWLAGMSMVLQVFSVGATLVVPETPEIDDVLDAIDRFDVNRANIWGDRLPKVREAAIARGIDVGRIGDIGGFRGTDGTLLPEKISMYGMTESFSSHSAEPLDVRLPADKAESYGRAINGYERRVVDPETGVEVPPGEVGEVQIRGPAMLAGFYKVERSKVFTPDGFYPTKDLVRIDSDGFLWPVGRLGDMIKTRAANVSRLEVEAALRLLPEVELPVVAGLLDEEFGQIVVAAVVLAEGASLTEESLKAALRATLSSFKVPRRIIFITDAEVPRTQTGKVKLFETADMIAARIGRAPAAVAD